MKPFSTIEKRWFKGLDCGVPKGLPHANYLSVSVCICVSNRRSSLEDVCVCAQRESTSIADASSAFVVRFGVARSSSTLKLINILIISATSTLPPKYQPIATHPPSKHTWQRCRKCHVCVCEWGYVDACIYKGYVCICTYIFGFDYVKNQ